ncbi:MAG: transmembrane 220 family protein, partial [Balneolaceae bacterium]|nr:transmembrane 220 family protein [Balneolaceae bacterium]
ASLLYAAGAYRRFVPILVLVIGLVWAAVLFPEFFEGEQFSFRTFSSVKMTNMEFETAREFGGLVIISLWMLIIALYPPAHSVQE